MNNQNKIMNMIKNALLLIPLFFLMTANAQEEWYDEEPFCCCEDSCFVNRNHLYAKLFTGANFLQKSAESGNKANYDTGYIISGSLGYYWCNGLCLEGEYAFRHNAISQIDFISEGSSRDGHFKTSSYMVNLLWDLPIHSWGCACWDIRSFIGAGIGYDFHQMHSSNSRIIFAQKWHHFSWQLMAGLGYSIFCNTELTVEYKFHQSNCHFYNHVLGVGIIYHFGSSNGFVAQ